VTGEQANTLKEKEEYGAGWTLVRGVEGKRRMFVPFEIEVCCSRIGGGSISRHIGCPGGDGSSGLFLAIVM